MTIKQAWKKLQTEAPLCNTPNNAMFDIDFINSDGYEDETQFTVDGSKSLEKCRNELDTLFKDFCKENGFDADSVLSITYVGRDPEYCS